jgi:hypothetical protein
MQFFPSRMISSFFGERFFWDYLTNTIKDSKIP